MPRERLTNSLALAFESPPEITFKMLFEFTNKTKFRVRDTDEITEKELRRKTNKMLAIHVARRGAICQVTTQLEPNSTDSVQVSVNEFDEEESIVDCYCSKCVHSKKVRVCKHSMSLLYFLCTATERGAWNWLEQWTKLLGEMKEAILNSDILEDCVSIRELIQDFRRQDLDFASFVRGRLTPFVSCRVAEITSDQSDSPLWHCLRRGRITASVLHEAAHCSTTNGSLVAKILGEYDMRDTYAMSRGRQLERQVLDSLGIPYRRVGVVLRAELPEFGASPDAITNDFVIEVKCPTSEASVRRYLTRDNKVGLKFYAQIQLQMYMTGRTRGLFCVASPDFEVNRKTTQTVVHLDLEYCRETIEKARRFWKEAIYPKLN